LNGFLAKLIKRNVAYCYLLYVFSTGSIAQSASYLSSPEVDFEVFRPAWATYCTDGGEIWHGGGDLGGPSVPPACQISPPSFTPIGATINVHHPQN